jgi:hypothetical protein
MRASYSSPIAALHSGDLAASE